MAFGTLLFNFECLLKASGPEVIKLISCSTELSMKYFNAHKYKNLKKLSSDKPRMLFSRS